MDLKKKTVRGITWHGISRTTHFVSHLAVTVILARLLKPSDFGLLGMANVFVSMITLLNERGWSGALVQNQNVDARHFSSVFWVNIIFSIAMMGILFCSAPFIAVFYKSPEVSSILRVLSLVFVIDSFVIVQRALCTKELNFKNLGIIDIISSVFGGVIGVYCGFKGFGVWSLVLQIISQNSVAALLFWFTSSWRPTFMLSLTALKQIYRFSVTVTFNAVLANITANIDYFLIGKFLGAQALGYYTLAFKFMMLPVRNIAWIVSSVMLPALSKVQANIEKVANNYLKMIKGISLIAVPLMAVLFVIIPEFIHGVIGDKWYPATILVRIFCICGVFRSIHLTCHPLILSQGRADLQLKLTILVNGVLIGAIVCGLKWGILGVTTAFTIAELCLVPYVLYRAGKLINLKLKDMSSHLIHIFVFGTILIIVLSTIKLCVRLEDLYQLVMVVFAWIVISTGFMLKFEKAFIKENILIQKP